MALLASAARAPTPPPGSPAATAAPLGSAVGSTTPGATATITGSSISANKAGGGGSAGGGSAATLASNSGGNAGNPQPGGDGGAIYNDGTLTVTGSTLSGNNSGAGGSGASGGAGNADPNGNSSASADGAPGGAVFTEGLGTATLTNDTITGNVTGAGGAGGTAAGAGGDGAGVFSQALAVDLSFLTVADNTAAGKVGGLDNGSIGVFNEADSIVASNTATGTGVVLPSNCSAFTPTVHITDAGNNLVSGDNSCPGTNADPKLGALAGNGGPTATMALGAGSPAIGLVPLNNCPLTTDQRGVSRPQTSSGLATHCDAGAYELAPATVASPSATGISASAAAVTANVDPNAQATTVTVAYGRTTSYGSSVQVPVSPGTSAVPITVALTGLSANTTYHAQIVATNADGSSTSADLTLSTLSVGIPSITSAGAAISARVSCNGGTAASICSGPITLSSHVTSHGHTIVAVAAGVGSKSAKPVKPATVTKLVTVGGGSYSVSSGHVSSVTIKLNGTGQTLLNQFYKLPVTITFGGSTPLAHTFTIRYTIIKSPISYTWAFGPSTTAAQELTVTAIPTGGKVTVVCHGGGCPFGKRTFTPRHGQVSLLGALARARLRPNASVEVEITAGSEVGKVTIFTIRSGQVPLITDLCLPPGARSPSRCVK